jgi:hypothetical protein
MYVQVKANVIRENMRPTAGLWVRRYMMPTQSSTVMQK